VGEPARYRGAAWLAHRARRRCARGQTGGDGKKTWDRGGPGWECKGLGEGRRSRPWGPDFANGGHKSMKKAGLQAKGKRGKVAEEERVGGKAGRR